ncbi:MAG: hypothetical protein M1826_003986 [Phylliscum demangeonii]|nr:MAG: hypothetical protein M1826_003986 [Phylliscum demangeonii]
MRFVIVISALMATLALASPARNVRRDVVVYVTDVKTVVNVVTVNAVQELASPTATTSPTSSSTTSAISSSSALRPHHNHRHVHTVVVYITNTPQPVIVQPTPTATPEQPPPQAPVQSQPPPEPVKPQPTPEQAPPPPPPPPQPQTTAQPPPEQATQSPHGQSQPPPQQQSQPPVQQQSPPPVQQPTKQVGSGNYQSKCLDHHNAHRANHSAPALEWDADLESIAKEIADTCVYAHSMNIRNGGYGQNIAAGATAAEIGAVISEQFYNNELELYPGYQGEPDMANFEGWGHFSQVVWKATTHVACYTTDCTSKGLKNVDGDVGKHFTVCNYKDPGNFGGRYAANIKAPKGDAVLHG